MVETQSPSEWASVTTKTRLLVHRRQADIDVHRRVPGVVQPSRDPADHHELHAVIDEHTAERGDPVAVDLTLSHGH